MATFSDGVDSLVAATMAGSPSNTHFPSGDMRFYLQTLLDGKEKQLQQAGTLGQQLLAQRMELEERIRQLHELDLEVGDDVAVDAGIRDKYRELAETIKQWDVENEHLSHTFVAKPTMNGTQGTPSSQSFDLSRSDLERSIERSKAAASGTTAAQSSRRAKNAAHRADDVEFAFEIGSGLLTEVRRLQSLLAERDKAIQDMKEEKDDLEKTIESLRTALRSQEQSADKYKEENWELEVTQQELRGQLQEAQSSNQRLEGEHKRLTKLLTVTRESVDQYKNEAERYQTTYEEFKAKHETDVAQARKHAASLQRDKSDLQQTLDSMKLEMAKASKRLPRFGSPLTPNGMSASEMLTPHEGDEDDVFSMGASTNRKRGDTSALFPPDGGDYLDSSPEPSPSKPFLAPNHPTNEIEDLQQRLQHAQRQINTLKGTLQREKELRMEYKRKLDNSPGNFGGLEEEDFEEDEETTDSKPRVRIMPERAARGRGRGRGGRTGTSLIHQFTRAAESPSSDWVDEDEVRETSPPPPVPAKPLTFQEEEEPHPLEEELQEEEVDPRDSPSPQLASNRASVASVTSVEGMDPMFANILRRSGSTSSIVRSPLRRSLLGRPARGLGPPRRARGGAAYQQNRPPSFAAEPEALSAEFGLNTMEDTVELPEVETAEMGCQTDFEEPPTPTIVLETPAAPPAPEPPVLAEVSIQVEPEPVPVAVTVEVSLQTDEAPIIVRKDFSAQYECVVPAPLLVSASVETDPIPEPVVPLPVEVPVPPSPSLSHAEVQTATISSVDVVIQTVPEITVAPARFTQAETQTLPEPLPSTTAIATQTDAVEETHAFPTVPAAASTMLDAYPAADSADTTMTITPRPPTLRMPYDDFEDDGTETETGSIFGEEGIETETDDYEDARQSISLTTPTESLDDDFHSIMTVSDNDFSDSDDESIKASRISSRAAFSNTPSTVSLQLASTSAVPPRTFEEVGVSADFQPEPRIVEVIKVKEIIRTVPAELPPKPEMAEISTQTDEPPAPAAPPSLLPAPVISAPPTPSALTTSLPTRPGPSSPQFQFISPPPSSGPTTASLPNVAAPSPSHRATTPTFIPLPRLSHSDRRQSIESTLSNAVVEELVARSRTPSGGPAIVDKSRPPMMVLPPPPRLPPPPATMPPPNFIPERKSMSREAPPPRPSSPPPPELIQRATTPTFGSVLSVPGGRPFGLRTPGSSVPSSQIGLRQPPSTGSFRSAGNAASRGQSSPSAPTFNLASERREMSTTSFNSNAHSIGSQRSSISSENHYDEPQPQPRLRNAPSTPERVSNVGTTAAPMPASRPAGPSSTDPIVIHAITQTMIGEFLYKYTRRAIGKGHGERRHKRFFWVHPYTRTLYWSSADPGSTGVAESSAKSAYIEDVRAVLDPNPMPPGIHQYSVVVSTPQREMKFTAPTKERHDIWLNALQYLLSRPSAVSITSPANGNTALQSPLSTEAKLPDLDNTPQHPTVFASPQSQRSARTTRTGLSTDSWNITPRGHRSQSQISLGNSASMGKRSGTPAAEYLRWAGHDGMGGMGSPQSPTKSFEHVMPGPSSMQDDDELDFELHDGTMSDEGYEGLENVRACCDGRHTVGRSGREGHHHHHHHHHQHQGQREPSRTRDQHLDPNPHEITRPVSPAWSFRSRAGSGTSHEGSGGGFFSRFGTRRSAKSTLASDR